MKPFAKGFREGLPEGMRYYLSPFSFLPSPVNAQLTNLQIVESLHARAATDWGLG